MEEYLRKNLGVESEKSQEQAASARSSRKKYPFGTGIENPHLLSRKFQPTSWTRPCRRWDYLFVRYQRQRFRLREDEATRFRLLQQQERSKIERLKENIRIAFLVQKAALQFIDDAKQQSFIPSEQSFLPSELASIVHNYDTGLLKKHGGVYGIARKISVSLDYGVRTKELPGRKSTYGLNRHCKKSYRGFLRFLWEALQDLTLMILMACAVVSIGIGLGTGVWADVMQDGIGIILSIFLVVMVIAISDYKQFSEFKDLEEERKHIMVQTTRNGYRENVPIYDLVVGDVVHLSAGDQIPADGLFISGYGLLIDESSLTGDIEPVNRDDKNPFLLSGTKVQDGWGKMMVTSVGMWTEWEKMLEGLSKGAEDETPLQMKLSGFLIIFGKIAWGFAVLTFVVLTSFLVLNALSSHWSLGDTLTLLNYFAISVAILVVAVPEGLPVAVPLSLAFATKKLMNDGALVTYPPACEIIGSVSCICTGKTGLLTANHMVDKLWINKEINVLNGEENGNNLRSMISEKVLSILLHSIFLNTGSEVVIGKDGKHAIFGTPIESALLEFGFLLGGDFDSQRRSSKIVMVEPFHPIKKNMSVLVSLPSGEFRAFCKGASDIILRMCSKIIDRNGEPIFLSEAHIKEVRGVINRYANRSLKTLCLAFKEIRTGDSIPTEGYTLIAVIGIKDTVQPGVLDAVQTCLDAGITIRLITDDNINTVRPIAKESGILTDDGIAVEGPHFRNLGPQEMKELLRKFQVFARSMPLDKLTLATQLRKSFGEVVAFTGDGIHDAPALCESDVGLAMGSATEAAKENADIIIRDDNFSTIVNVVKWGRAVYMNIEKLVQFQLTVLLVVPTFTFISACISGSPPLNVVQLLWIHMIMDTLATFALGTEPPDSIVMQRPPVGRNANFITRVMWRNIIGQTIYQLAVLGVLKLHGKQLLKLGGADADIVLDTLVFNTCVFCLVFNKISSRDMEKINVFRGICENWIFITVLVATVAFQVIIIEFLGILTSTVPLSRQLWLFSVIIGASNVIFASAIKLIPVVCKQRATDESHEGYVPIPTGPDLA